MPLRPLQAEPFFFAATKIKIGRGLRCRYDHYRQAVLSCSSEDAASIRKSGLEIKNRCTQDGLNGENRAGHPPARVYKRGSAGGKSEVFCVKVGSTVAAKRVLMSPEAAFPYVFAAEGAQHPPKKPPRTKTLAAAPAQKPPHSTTLAAAPATPSAHPSHLSQKKG